MSDNSESNNTTNPAAQEPGFIALQKSIRLDPIWGDKPFSLGQCFLDLVLQANWCARQWVCEDQTITIQPGQLVTSIKKLSIDWGCSRGKVSRVLKTFTKRAQIETKSGTRYTVITILNYFKFQVSKIEGVHKTRTKRSQNVHETDTTNIDNINNYNLNTNTNSKKKNNRSYLDIGPFGLTLDQALSDPPLDDDSQLPKCLIDAFLAKGCEEIAHNVYMQPILFDTLKNKHGNIADDALRRMSEWSTSLRRDKRGEPGWISYRYKTDHYATLRNQIQMLKKWRGHDGQ